MLRRGALTGMGMKTGLVACAIAALSAAPAFASAYSEFNAGIAARNGRYCDLAIAHETAALDAPDFLASLKPIAFLVRGECKMVGGKAEAAIPDFDAALVLKPDNIRLHIKRGVGLTMLKRYDAAAADFQDVIRLRPDLTVGYVALGALYNAQKLTDQEIAQYTALIAAQPSYAVGYLLRSRAYMAKGDMDGALADADHIVSLAPQDATGYVQRATVYQAQGKFDRALSDLDDALDRRHNDVFASLLKGTVQWELGRYSDAEDTLKPLAQNDLTTGYALLWLALSRMSGNKPDDGFATLAAKMDRSKWPGPLVTLYLGLSTPDSVVAGFYSAASEDRERDVCEGEFYTGEWQLRHDAKDAGLVLLRKAASDCPVSYVERAAATTELGRTK